MKPGFLAFAAALLLASAPAHAQKNADESYRAAQIRAGRGLARPTRGLFVKMDHRNRSSRQAAGPRPCRGGKPLEARPLPPKGPPHP